MDIQERALRLLGDTEESLRQLMEEALSANDYRSLSMIAEWADQLSILGKNTRPKAIASKVPNNETSVPSGSRGPRKKGQGTYPRFLADGDQLIKIGWSKKRKREYEQRASRALLDTLVDKLKQLTVGNSRFTMEEALPLSAPESNEEFPSYKPYLCVAWLRHLGFIKKQGKEGYWLASVEDWNTVLDEAWASLPDREQDLFAP